MKMQCSFLILDLLLVSATNTRLLPWCLYASLKCYNIDFSPSAFVSVWPKVHLFCYLGKQNYTTDEDCFFIWHCQLRHMRSWWCCLYKLILTIRHMHCIKNLAYTHVKGMLGENTWISLWLPLNNGKGCLLEVGPMFIPTWVQRREVQETKWNVCILCFYRT